MLLGPKEKRSVWPAIDRIRTDVVRCNYHLHKWGILNSLYCDCGDTLQTHWHQSGTLLSTALQEISAADAMNYTSCHKRQKPGSLDLILNFKLQEIKASVLQKSCIALLVEKYHHASVSCFQRNTLVQNGIKEHLKDFNCVPPVIPSSPAALFVL